eukprot:gene9770-10805_t
MQSYLFFIADALCDGGAAGELALPARKIVQLGLQPFDRYNSKGSTNNAKKSYKFTPAVLVEIKLLETMSRPPVLHRLNDPAKVNDRVVLGNVALRRLRVHANFENGVLEIEEEVECEE